MKFLRCFPFLFLFSVSVFSFFGCENKKVENAPLKIQDSSSVPVKQEVKMDYDSFTQEQKNSWDSIEQEWEAKIFYPAIVSEGFNQDCETCGDLVWLLEIKIDENGRVLSCDVSKRDIDCAKRTDEQQEKFEKDVLNWFPKQLFPKQLRNKIIKVHAGKATKC